MNPVSVRDLYREAAAAVRRFPLSAALCAAAAAAAWRMAGLRGPEPHLQVTLMLTFAFGAALFYALALVNENFPLPAPARPRHLLAAGGLFLVLFFFRFAAAEGLEFGPRLGQWVFMVIMLASCGPFLRGREPLALWQFNRRLVVGGAVAAVSTVVLFAGISLALAAVDKLLGLKVEPVVYQRLWITAAFLFWPLHFMAATPARPAGAAAGDAYPNGLKLFTKYVLLPLASVYFLILYAYMGKILVTQQWPQGWVSLLTTSASALGLAAFLLLWPVSEGEESRRYRAFSRGFCAAALPLLGMLFAAVYQRVAQYGLTEPRYFLICLGLWLACMFVYFLLSRRPDIRYVPMTLAALALLTSAGPWSAYSAGLASQSARLERLLAGNGLLAGGRAVRLDRELPAETRRDISGVLDYIVGHHGAEALEKYFPAGNRTSREFMAFLGQEYLRRWEKDGPATTAFRADLAGIPVAGYDLAVKFYARAAKAPAPPPKAGWQVQVRREERLAKVFRDGKFLADVPLGPLLEAAAAAGRPKEGVPQAALRAEASGPSARVALCLTGASLERPEEGPLKPNHLEGLLLVRESGARR